MVLRLFVAVVVAPPRCATTTEPVLHKTEGGAATAVAAVTAVVADATSGGSKNIKLECVVAAILVLALLGRLMRGVPARCVQLLGRHHEAAAPRRK
jgi:hypothetical protein